MGGEKESSATASSQCPGPGVTIPLGRAWPAPLGQNSPTRSSHTCLLGLNLRRTHLTPVRCPRVPETAVGNLWMMSAFQQEERSRKGQVCQCCPPNPLGHPYVCLEFWTRDGHPSAGRQLGSSSRQHEGLTSPKPHPGGPTSDFCPRAPSRPI